MLPKRIGYSLIVIATGHHREFPIGRKEDFYGRESDLECLQSMLTKMLADKNDNGRKIIVIQGGIGYGKTQLCLYLARLNRSR